MKDYVVNLTGKDNLSSTINKVKNELKDTGGAAAELDKITQKFNKIENSAAPLKKKLRDLQNLMSQMNFKGLTNTEIFSELASSAARYRDAMNDASQAVRVLSSDTANLDAGIQAFQTLAGVAGIAQGAMGLLGKENQDLEKAILKVQSAISIMNGVQSVANSLNKDSVLMLKLKQLWNSRNVASTTVAAAATTLQAQATKSATAAQVALNTALKASPYILLATVIAAAGTALWNYVKASKEASIAQEQAAVYANSYNAAMEDIAKARETEGAEIGKLIGKYKALQIEWNSLKTIQQKQQFIRDNETAFHDLGLSINTVRDAEQAMVNDTSKVVAALIARARAIAASNELIRVEQEHMQELNKLEGSGNQKYKSGTKYKDLDKKDKNLVNIVNENWEVSERDLAILNRLNDQNINQIREANRKYEIEAGRAKETLENALKDQQEASKELGNLKYVKPTKEPKKTSKNDDKDKIKSADLLKDALKELQDTANITEVKFVELLEKWRKENNIVANSEADIKQQMDLVLKAQQNITDEAKKARLADYYYKLEQALRNVQTSFVQIGSKNYMKVLENEIKDLQERLRNLNDDIKNEDIKVQLRLEISNKREELSKLKKKFSNEFSEVVTDLDFSQELASPIMPDYLEWDGAANKYQYLIKQVKEKLNKMTAQEVTAIGATELQSALNDAGKWIGNSFVGAIDGVSFRDIARKILSERVFTPDDFNEFSANMIDAINTAIRTGGLSYEEIISGDPEDLFKRAFAISVNKFAKLNELVNTELIARSGEIQQAAEGITDEAQRRLVIEQKTAEVIYESLKEFYKKYPQLQGPIKQLLDYGDVSAEALGKMIERYEDQIADINMRMALDPIIQPYTSIRNIAKELGKEDSSEYKRIDKYIKDAGEREIIALQSAIEALKKQRDAILNSDKSLSVAEGFKMEVEKSRQLQLEVPIVFTYPNMLKELKLQLKEVYESLGNVSLNIADDMNQLFGDSDSAFSRFLDNLSSMYNLYKDISDAIEIVNGLMKTNEAITRVATATAALQNTTEQTTLALREGTTFAISGENTALQSNLFLKQADATASLVNASALGTETGAHIANANAATVDAAAETMKAHAKIPFVGITIGAGLIAAMLIALASSKNKFANGGIVGGNSFQGDKVLARVNSGEMILNKRQQTRLFNLIDGGAMYGGTTDVKFVIEGKQLTGVLKNYNTSKAKLQ